ncbi:MAG: FAD-dependent oxidoreductase, partial [Acidimicrobiia bacterium]|nr:FAD-dependent oxidoreductase [Acidimicrobiia bacterium]
MSDLPTRATCVIIGAGIVGNCLAGHLARLGWTDMVLLDKGPLPNPGGSTGHASNFIFPTDHNKEMALLTLESQRQYEEMGVNATCGGIEVARDDERLEEFRRRMTSAKAWGIDAELLTPAQIKERVPFINEEVLLGGFYTPSVSVVDSLQAGTIMREEAVAAGALSVSANTEVLDLEVTDGTISAVVTDKGRVEADHVAIACGVWSPRIAAMAGANIPLTPAVHQMADVGPIDVLQESNAEVAYPIVRDMDTFCYERQTAGSMEVGSYAHRPIFHHPDDIPSIEESALSPTELPLTFDDFDPQMEQAIELMEMLGEAEIKYAINGLLSLTPDAMPVLGETVEVRNLWSAAAVWIKEGPGIAQLMAEWMTHGYPHICDPHGSDIARFYPHERTEHHINARCAEHFNKTYGIVHPREQWASERAMRQSPFTPRQVELGAVYYDARGWERPQWYESNAALVETYTEQCADRPHEWDARWWSPISNAEHLAMRAGVGMVDLTAFNEFDVTGPGAVDYLNWMCVNNVDVPVGRSIYTPLLTADGGFRTDLTIMRLAHDHYRVITGAFDGGR